MSELKPCEPAHDGEYQGRFDAICQHYGIRQSDRYFLQSAIDALEEQDNQPANEPLTLEEQWVETASDNTDYALTYAEGLYCVTDVAGCVVCEFIRCKPESEGGVRK